MTDNLFGLLCLVALILVVTGMFGGFALFVLERSDEMPPQYYAGYQYYEGYKAGFSFAMNVTRECCLEYSDPCLKDPEMQGILDGVMND